MMSSTITHEFGCDRCSNKAGKKWEYPLGGIPPVPELPEGWTRVRNWIFCPNHNPMDDYYRLNALDLALSQGSVVLSTGRDSEGSGCYVAIEPTNGQEVRGQGNLRAALDNLRFGK